MTEERRTEERRTPTPATAWTEAMLNAPFRVQAAFAADTLRRLNQPLVDSLEAQRQLSESLATAAEQIALLAQQVERLARQHAAVYEQARAAMEPYLTYVDWLGGVGGGTGGGAGRTGGGKPERGDHSA
jgi:hypothetical protein